MTLIRFTILSFISLFIIACGGGSSAPNNPPKAIASANKLTFTEGETIYLNGSQSSDPDGDQLTYQWEYSAEGKQYKLEGIKPAFKAPEVSENESTLEVVLTVKDQNGKSSNTNKLKLTITNFDIIIPDDLDCVSKAPPSETYHQTPIQKLSGSALYSIVRLHCFWKDTSASSLNIINKFVNLEDLTLESNAGWYPLSASNSDAPSRTFPRLHTLKKLRKVFISGAVNQSDLSNLSLLSELTDFTIAFSVIDSTMMSNISNATQLQKLRMITNFIPQPIDLSNFTELKTLEVTGNQLNKIDDLSNLNELEYLSFHSNQISELPDFSSLTKLKTLDLSRNRLTSLPDLSALAALEILDINSNKIASLPDLFSLERLSYLDISYNLLTTLPELYELKSLKILFAGNNQITVLPNLSALTKLQALSMRDNKLSELPDISALIELSSLVLSGNTITTLPDFSSNKKLKGLAVDGNNLTTLPDSLYSLRELKSLFANRNALVEFPDISKLTVEYASFSFYPRMDISPLLRRDLGVTDDIFRDIGNLELIMHCRDDEMVATLPPSFEIINEYDNGVSPVNCR